MKGDMFLQGIFKPIYQIGFSKQHRIFNCICIYTFKDRNARQASKSNIYKITNAKS